MLASWLLARKGGECSGQGPLTLLACEASSSSFMPLITPCATPPHYKPTWTVALCCKCDLQLLVRVEFAVKD